MFMTISSRAIGVPVFRYLVFNVVGGIFLLYGSVFMYGITSFSDLAGLLYDAKFAGAGLNYGFVIFVAGLFFKLFSLPLFSVLETIYTKLNAGLLVVLVVAVEMAYIGLLYRVFLIGFTAPALAAISQISLVSLMALAVLVSGFAAVRAQNLVAGLLYSSVQQVAFILCTLVVSYNVTFGSTAAVIYYGFYALTVFFMFVLLGLLESGLYSHGYFYNAARCLVCCCALS